MAVKHIYYFDAFFECERNMKNRPEQSKKLGWTRRIGHFLHKIFSRSSLGRGRAQTQLLIRAARAASGKIPTKSIQPKCYYKAM